MSGIFALSDSDRQLKDEQAALNPLDLSQAHVGLFHGTGEAVRSGVMRGGAKVAEAVMLATAAPAVAYDYFAGTEHADTIFKAIDDYGQPAVDYWTPGPRSIGTAAKVLGGLSEIALPLAAAGGNPEAMIASQSLPTGKELVSQGVSPGRATAVATTDALAAAAGFKLPFLGKTLLSRMGTGAAGNAGLGIASRLADRELLKGSDAPQLAEDFNPLDPTSLTVDMLSGLAFGGIHHLASPRVLPSHTDAALTAKNAKHFQEDTAPGVPADVPSSVAHQDAIEKAMTDILRGEPTSVDPKVTEANFIAREPRPTPDAVKEYAEKSNPSDVIPSEPSLSQSDRAIERRFANQITADVDAAIKDYNKLPDAEGGKVLAGDVARELSPDYLKDRTKSAAVQEPSSWLIKEMYARKLAEQPKEGQLPLVVFSAGGTGAGKTTGLKALEKESPTIKSAQIIYDSNMSSFRSAVEKIDQAVAAGKKVEVLYTYRNPAEALKNGVLKRGMKQEAEFGTGRTVPIDIHAKTHVNSRAVIEQVAEHYKDSPDVRVTAIDNSQGKGKPAIVKLDELPKLEYNTVREEALKTLEAEREAGTISDSIYRGVRGESQERGLGSRPPSDRAGIREQSESQRDGGSGSRASPVISAAHQALAEADIQIPTGEIDADGNAKTMSAREAMAQAADEVARAQNDAKGFDAAVTCFLANGA